MSYEINVAKNGHHYFATAARSARDDATALYLYNHFKKLFPLSEGFTINVTKTETVGRVCHFDKVDSNHPDQGASGNLFQLKNTNATCVSYFMPDRGGSLYRRVDGEPWKNVSDQKDHNLVTQLHNAALYSVKFVHIDFGG